AEFSRIIVKRGAKGEVIRLSEIGTVDLGAKNYAVTSNLDGKPAATLAIYQLPGSIALSTAWLGRRRRNAADTGHSSVRGNARRNYFRYLPYARFLRDNTKV